MEKPNDRKSALDYWVIYENPADLGQGIWARRFVLEHHAVKPDSSSVFRSPTLTSMRANMAARGLTRIDRQHGDDITVIETWL